MKIYEHPEFNRFFKLLEDNKKALVCITEHRYGYPVIYLWEYVPLMVGVTRVPEEIISSVHVKIHRFGKIHSDRIEIEPVQGEEVVLISSIFEYQHDKIRVCADVEEAIGTCIESII